MPTLRERVSQVYYTHGLFCASHPFSILITVCSLILVLCYPLLFAPLPGNIPAEYLTPTKDYQVPPEFYGPRQKTDENTDVTSIPRWYKGQAVGYVQQIVVKAVVSPWEPTQHDPLDALNAPLNKVFDILEKLDKFRHQHGDDEEKMLVNCCLRVSEPMRSKHSNGLLPEYGCLTLSPANLWKRNRNSFLKDEEVLNTIFKRYNQAMEAPPGIRAVLFGLPWRRTGISRYFIRTRQRTISYAVTVVLKSYDEKFVTGLRNSLETLFPETLQQVNNSEIDYLVHLHYKNINIYFEYIHLVVLYLVLLLYLYFSVKKIDLVKSKWGLALSAVVTVVSSLFISVSVCTYFGMNTHLNGGEIFPYLVMLIGIENVLVVTKSVVSTSVELEVKHRVATGLSKEGWYITKNLLTELIIVIVGFFTFVPAIQEFCLFALVGLLSDFFLQMIFFVTVLCVDIRRMELSDLHKHSQESSGQSLDTVTLTPLFTCPFKAHFSSGDRLKIGPRISLSTGLGMVSQRDRNQPTVRHRERPFDRNTFLDLPRRLRLIYFWASTRVVQRFIMVCSVIWIVLIVYKTGLVPYLTDSNFSENNSVTPQSVDDLEQIIKLQEQTNTVDSGKAAPFSLLPFWSSDEDQPGSVKHSDLETWRQLSHAHWITLFGYYNITIIGKYITMLPTIHLSLVIPPEEAIQLRVPDFKFPHSVTNKDRAGPKVPHIPSVISTSTEKDESHSVKNDFDSGGQESIRSPSRLPPKMQEPNFLSEEYLKKYYPYLDIQQIKEFYPRSRKEIVITVCLAILSVICLTYFSMMLYRCMCSRKYSKWRASWSKTPRYSRSNNYFKQIKEAVPIILKGHLQEIECLLTDGSVIISSCLGGQLRVWDSITGECLHTMPRMSATPPAKRNPCEGRNIEDSEADRYEEFHGHHSNTAKADDLDIYGIQSDTPRPRHRRISERKDDLITVGQQREQFEEFPDLKPTLDLDFRNIASKGEGQIEKMCPPGGGDGSDVSQRRAEVGFDFKSKFESLFGDQKRIVEERKEHQRHKRSNSDIQGAMGNRSKSWSEGDLMQSDSEGLHGSPPSVWCLACRGNLIIAGCGNGNIEFWDATTGVLKCLYGECNIGITGVNFVGRRVIVARLDGSIDFLELETFQDPKAATPLSPSSLNRKIKGHSRHLSHSRTGSDDLRLWNEIIHCTLAQRTQAHQRPITVLQTEGGRIVSGSQDFTLKVFRLEDYRCLHTLHGHTGAITCLCLDKCPPYAAVSGSVDGTIRLWDLLNGHCVHKIHSHEGALVGLLCTDVHIISSGMDDKMCVWDRKRGQLLYSVEIDTTCGSSMTMMSNNFLVTGGQGSLYLWDVFKGELVRVVNLQDRSHIAFIHHIQAMENSTIVCDYGNKVKVIHFPVVLEKRD